jgi:stalled ribosome alternative rescue factor ArfA
MPHSASGPFIEAAEALEYSSGEDSARCFRVADRDTNLVFLLHDKSSSRRIGNLKKGKGSVSQHCHSETPMRGRPARREKEEPVLGGLQRD